MKTKIKKSSAVAVLLIFSFSLIPFDFSSENLFSAKASNEEISDDDTWEGVVEITGSVSITNGAILTIKPGTKVVFNPSHPSSPASLVVESGKIQAEGIMENPIIFDKKDDEDKYSIVLDDDLNSQSFFRFVQIKNGGFKLDAPPIIIFGRNDFSRLNVANAQTAQAQSAALEIYSGSVHIENSIFSSSEYAAVRVESEGKAEIVNSNFEDNVIAVTSIVADGDDVLLKNNWYGDPLDPKEEDDDGVTDGDQILGNAALDSWRTNDLIVDPVIIVPGIMGSEKSFFGWTLDPITHSYGDLLDSLEKNGYEKDINIFKFPYQWRNSNIETAILLKEKIQDVVNETKISKVDVVAHSMGGLVARQYIENDYQDNIDQFVALGTPHRGSPEAYLKWEAGEGFFGFKNYIAKHHFENEAKHKGFDSLFEYIQDSVLSVGELLPDYSYLFDIEKNEMRNYSDGYPRNEFLEELNKYGNTEKMQNIDFVNIVGKVGLDSGKEVESTISQINVVQSEKDGLWEDGMPEDFYKDALKGINEDVGDETVPLSSAADIFADTLIKIDSSHGDLPTKAQCLVLEELAGIDKDDCEYVDNIDITNILLINIFSPIDVQVVAPDGKKVGKNFQNGDILSEIDGAYYTGYETDNEFFTIPNPQDGEYKILTQGTGDGAYEIQAVKIQEDSETGEVSEISGSVKGIAKNGEEKEVEMNLAEGEIVMGNIDTIPPVIQISSPKEREYLNNQMLDLKYEIIDDQTSQENIQKQILFDGDRIDEDNLDLSLMHLGKHSFKIVAIDEAKNESEKEVIFQTETSPIALRDNIGHYFDLRMIKQKAIADRLVQCTKVLEHYQSVLERIQTQKGVPGGIRKKLLKRMKASGDMYINQIITYIEGKVRKGKITKEAGSLLIEGFDSLK